MWCVYVPVWNSGSRTKSRLSCSKSCKTCWAIFYLVVLFCCLCGEIHQVIDVVFFNALFFASCRLQPPVLLLFGTAWSTLPASKVATLGGLCFKRFFGHPIFPAKVNVSRKLTHTSERGLGNLQSNLLETAGCTLNYFTAGCKIATSIFLSHYFVET
jgi:hypothetical protein